MLSPVIYSEPIKHRGGWDEYFMSIADVVKNRSTCPRKSVGAVIVKDRHILSTGYNGSARGDVHCTDVGCAMVNEHCVRTVHAEVNALLQAAKVGVGVGNAVMYCTSSPCMNCSNCIINSGLGTLYYRETYDSSVVARLRKLGVRVIQI